MPDGTYYPSGPVEGGCESGNCGDSQSGSAPGDFGDGEALYWAAVGASALDQDASVAVGCRITPNTFVITSYGDIVADHCAIRLNFEGSETEFAELEGSPGSDISIAIEPQAAMLDNGNLFTSWDVVAWGEDKVETVWSEIQQSQEYYENNRTPYSFWPWANSNRWVTKMLDGAGISTDPVNPSHPAPGLGWP